MWLLLLCMMVDGEEVCNLHDEYQNQDYCEVAMVEYNEALKQVPTLLERDPGAYFKCKSDVTQ